MDGDFGLTVKELRDLMELRKTDAIEAVKNLGGVPGVCQKLKTSPTEGLTGDPSDLHARQRAFGKNLIPPAPAKSFCELLIEAVQDLTLIVLLVSASISLVLWGTTILTQQEGNNVADDDEEHGWIDSVAIYASVAVVVFVTAGNDYTKEKQFRGLQSKIEGEHSFAVIRGGQSITINVADIVVGDIIQIRYGDLVPADGIILASNDLKIDESSLTGESDHVKKGDNHDPMVLSGTHVMEGSAKIVVTAIGVNSQSGIIFTLLGATGKEKEEDTKDEKDKDKKKKKRSDIEMKRIESYHENRKKTKSKISVRQSVIAGASRMGSKSKVEPQQEEGDGSGLEKSVLQAKLTKLAILIGYFGLIAAVLTTVIVTIRFCYINYIYGKRPAQLTDGKHFVNFIITGITILVVAVPEGLPLAVTLSLIYSCKKMMKDNNLVRHLDACETMGNATAICSDKTGTLTTNRMTVVQAFVFGNRSSKLPKHADLPLPFADILVDAISVNSGYTSLIQKPATQGELAQQIGNKTECALLGFVLDMGKAYEESRKRHPEESFTKVYTFNSVRKSMSTVVPLENNGGWRIFTKGASEIVMFKCKWIFGAGGKLEEFSKDKQEKLVTTVIEPMAHEGLRTISVAYKDFKLGGASQPNEVSVSGMPNWEDENEITNGLTCLCIVGIEDPVRPEVPEAIRKCQRAGITVRMVTGDNINTARSIATKCGILRPGDNGIILEGKDFNKLIRDANGEVRQELLDKVWPTLRVLARSSPTDKYVLVKGIIDSTISEHREVVAVTGDGTNDGPALKKADVGFAMGIAGTDVAKEASDIILTDDNFTSIVKAVMWGRKVYDSIAKFLQFQLTVNIVAVSVAIIGACTTGSSPLKAVQMLWVNLIMDTLASLALATELPTPDLLLRKPYGRTKSLISGAMAKNMLGQAAYQLAVVLFLLYGGHKALDFDYALESTEPSTHLTMVFNTFVMMTLFNEINARKIHGERNVFKGIFTNVYFVVIWVFTMVAQVGIIFIGDRVFFTNFIELEYWLWCLGFGFGTLAWHQILNSIPSGPVDRLLDKMRHSCKKKKQDDEERGA